MNIFLLCQVMQNIVLSLEVGSEFAAMICFFLVMVNLAKFHTATGAALVSLNKFQTATWAVMVNLNMFDLATAAVMVNLK